MGSLESSGASGVQAGGAECGALDARLASHPCFSSGCSATSARIHLAVAPRCNIACNYCVRKFDCVNESRPGVASSVLTPQDALVRFQVTREKLGNLTVAGIAGPGDALANWPAVKRTFDLIRADDPNIALCLSTNGLLLPRYAEEIARLGVAHATVTVNAVDAHIGARICRRVVYDGRAYEGVEAARLLLENQLEGIRRLVDLGVMVKVNTVLVAGVNVGHAIHVARTVANLGATCQNITSMIPVEGSVLQDVPALGNDTLQQVRAECECYIRQIRHCRQCRSDAVGLLGHDISQTIDELVRKLTAPKRIAVASRSGTMVDTHFGHAESFLVFEVSSHATRLIESRAVAPFCHGRNACPNEGEGEHERLDAIKAVADCDAVLCSWAGPEPQALLKEHNTLVLSGASPNERIAQACSFGPIEAALQAAYEALR